MEKDLFMGPTAVVAVTHSSLYWPVEGQEEDLGTMARSCWEERTKEEATERRAASAVRRICRCMLLACLLAYYTGTSCRDMPDAKVFLYPERQTQNQGTRNYRPSRCLSHHQNILR